MFSGVQFFVLCNYLHVALLTIVRARKTINTSVQYSNRAAIRELKFDGLLALDTVRDRYLEGLHGLLILFLFFLQAMASMIQN